MRVCRLTRERHRCTWPVHIMSPPLSCRPPCCATGTASNARATTTPHSQYNDVTSVSCRGCTPRGVLLWLFCAAPIIAWTAAAGACQVATWHSGGRRAAASLQAHTLTCLGVGTRMLYLPGLLCCHPCRPGVWHLLGSPIMRHTARAAAHQAINWIPMGYAQPKCLLAD